MRKTDSVKDYSAEKSRHLTLVTADGTRRLAQVHPQTVAPPDRSTVQQLAHAMINRLWISPTTSIVGLLDVGLSRSNFDELSKWIAQQCANESLGDAANELPRLERQFLRAVDRFPEL